MSYSDESTGLASLERNTYTLMFSKCGLSSQMATCVEAPSQDYDLISFLGIVQHLRIEILPVAWQPALDKVGLGGTAEIRQAHVKSETGFAFKLIKQAERARWNERRIFQMLVSEISVLGHPLIREHPNVISLQGICWDAAPNGQIWPVLVFKRAEFGNLKEFAESDIGQGMSFEDRCRLCASIAVAVRDMHMFQIIHGDIKPENVLIFKNHYGDFVAQVADFGYSTLYAGQGLIEMPYSKGWTAPEWGQRGGFKFLDAKKMDAFSFGTLCLWFLFHTSRKDGDSTFRNNLESISPTSFHASQTIMATTWLDVQQKRHLCQLFELTLIKNPAERSSDFNQFAQLLDIYYTRASHDTALLDENPFQIYPKFRIVPSMYQLCRHHYGVRAYIITCLEQRATESSLLPSQLAAFELAICCKLGFGINRDDGRSELLLNDAKRSKEDFENEIKMAKYMKRGSSPRGGFYHQTSYEALAPYSSPARYYLDQGQTVDTVRRLREEIGDLEFTLGSEHEILLLLKFHLSEVFRKQEDWERTEEMQTQVMKMASRLHGKTHVDTLLIMGGLASTYVFQNRSEEAEKLLLQVKESKLLPTHPVRLHSLQLLASISRDQGRWKEAEEMQLQVVKSRKSTLGLEHKETLVSMNSLAKIHRSQKRWREAEDISLQVIKKLKSVQGLDHSDTLTSMALEALRLERWKEAEGLEREVVQRNSTQFGPEHSNTLGSMTLLAYIYRRQGWLKEAEELYKKVAETRERVSGPEHPSTLESLTDLALTFEAQDRWREAEEMHKQVLEKTKGFVESDDLATMKIIDHLASNYQGQKEWEKAEILRQQAVQMSTAALGPKHPRTLIRLHNLAAILWSQKRWTEAEKLQLQVMEMNLQVLGSNHLETLNSMTWLAQTYASQERWKDAEALHLQALPNIETILGPEHPTTLLEKSHLAHTYKGQKRWKEAENLLVQVMNANVVTFGQEHLSTLHSMHYLTVSYINQERWNEAEELAVQLLAIRKRVLGAAHCQTMRSMTHLALIYHGRGQLEEKEGLETEVTFSKTSPPVVEQECTATLPRMPRSESSWTAQKCREEALLLLSEVVVLSKEVLGSDHGATIARIKRLNEWTTES